MVGVWDKKSSDKAEDLNIVLCYELKQEGKAFKSEKHVHNDIVTNKPDLTERICQAIREVKLMREGKIKELSMDELLDEL